MRLIRPSAAPAAPRFRGALVGLAAVALIVTACDAAATASPSAVSSPGNGDTNGDSACASSPVTVGFSAPAADHGWLGAIISNAQAEADKHSDVTYVTASGGEDANAQADNIRTLLEQNPDVVAILPYDGAALTPVAMEITESGVPVVNIDREFAEAGAFRTLIKGDNYGIGWAAGQYIRERLDGEGSVVELAGIQGISVTDQRSQGFADAIEGSNIEIVATGYGDFNSTTAATAMETILQAQDQIDAVYSHDDDQNLGAIQAVRNAGREDEMFFTGAGGSKAAFDEIKEGGIYAATYLYNPSMSASAVSLARLIALGCGLPELAEPEVPRLIELAATEVTQDNVDAVYHLGFE